MAWSAENAAIAYLDTVKLCKIHRERRRSAACLPTNTELQSTEFISALAAGISANLIVEIISRGATSSTIALAAAARQTGGHLVCILPEVESLQDSVETMKELGLEGTAEFLVGDATKLLPRYVNIDFALVDCSKDDHTELLDLLKVNPFRAVVVANNLFDREARAAYAKAFNTRSGAKSIALPIGRGIEVTRINGHLADHCKYFNASKTLNVTKRWVVKIDKRTGEEHMFRVRDRNRSNAGTRSTQGDCLDNLCSHEMANY